MEKFLFLFTGMIFIILLFWLVEKVFSYAEVIAKVISQEISKEIRKENNEK